jgi:class 3 adenylate cyclase
MRFFDVLPLVTALLQRELRVTYGALQYAFGFDDTFMDVLKKELIFKRVAVDENGEGLVWVGPIQPSVTPVFSSPSTELTITNPALTVTRDDTLPVAPDTLPPVPQNVPIIATELAHTPDAERRQLTVMFCDLVGSTNLSGQLDPEDLREVVRAYQKTATEVIQRYDGHVAQLLGDGLLVYFGFPRAHEDDAQRAVYTGLGIIEAMERLNTRLEREKNVRLAVRLGVHTGPVVVGEMGGSGRQEQLALGETPNIAARLEALAVPNTLVISTITARLVQGLFALEDLGTHALKGVSEPIVVFRILGPLERQRDEESTASDGAAFLVGRDEEMGLLRRRWEQSKEGLGQVVLISGEAGVGKSALIEVLRTHVRQEGYTRIAFRCSPYHKNLPIRRRKSSNAEFA